MTSSRARSKEAVKNHQARSAAAAALDAGTAAPDGVQEHADEVAAEANDADVTHVAAKAKPGKAVTYSFTVSSDEAQLVDAVREQYQRDGVKRKKSIVLRAALLALGDIAAPRMEALLAQAAETAERARPKKKKK